MPRWTDLEQDCVNVLKSQLKEELAASPQYPEIVGERKMIRFLRGHNFDVNTVYTKMANYLKWRKDNNVNEIRTNIVERGYDHPSKFPKGELILSLIPQLIIIANATDKQNCPICVEQYNFVPSEVFKHITIEDYIHFVMYSLEFRSLVVEQLSEQREQAYLNGLTEEERAGLEDPDSKPYGVITTTCVVRDLNGVGFAHLTTQGQDIIKSIVAVAADNYPELMRKCFMINAPFIFNAVWYMVKGFLSPRTIAKVSMMGGGYMNDLLQDIEYENLPAMVGGGYTGFVTYEPFVFDLQYMVPEGGSGLNSSDISSGSGGGVGGVSSSDSRDSGDSSSTKNTTSNTSVSSSISNIDTTYPTNTPTNTTINTGVATNTSTTTMTPKHCNISAINSANDGVVEISTDMYGLDFNSSYTNNTTTNNNNATTASGKSKSPTTKCVFLGSEGTSGTISGTCSSSAVDKNTSNMASTESDEDEFNVIAMRTSGY